MSTIPRSIPHEDLYTRRPVAALQQIDNDIPQIYIDLGECMSAAELIEVSHSSSGSLLSRPELSNAPVYTIGILGIA